MQLEYINLGCNFDCLSCKRTDCQIKELMNLSVKYELSNKNEGTILFDHNSRPALLNSETAENFFCYSIKNILETMGGVLISYNAPLDVVKKEINYVMVSLYLDRKRLLDNQRAEK